MDHPEHDKPSAATRRVEMADFRDDVASLWEVAIKVQAGKLDTNIAPMADRIGQNGAALLGVTVAPLTALKPTLPRHHRAPFDHLPITQATTEGAWLMSEHAAMRSYPLLLLACSD